MFQQKILLLLKVETLKRIAIGGTILEQLGRPYFLTKDNDNGFKSNSK